MNTELNSRLTARIFWRDGPYLCALLAGPACWLILLAVGLSRSSAYIDVWILLRLVMLMPILEEIVFRGGVQAELSRRIPAFAKHCYGVSLANVVTSVLFAAMHLFNQPPLWAALVFFPSLLFGWARDRFDSVIPSIILHCVYNAGFALLFVEMAPSAS